MSSPEPPSSEGRYDYQMGDLTFPYITALMGKELTTELESHRKSGILAEDSPWAMFPVRSKKQLLETADRETRGAKLSVISAHGHVGGEHILVNYTEARGGTLLPVAELLEVVHSEWVFISACHLEKKRADFKTDSQLILFAEEPKIRSCSWVAFDIGEKIISGETPSYDRLSGNTKYWTKNAGILFPS